MTNGREVATARGMDLDEMQARTPRPNPVQALRSSLLMAVLEGVTEKDMAEIAAGLVSRAKAPAKTRDEIADRKSAINTLLKLVSAPGAEPPKPAAPAIVRERIVHVDKPVMVAGVPERQLRLLVAFKIRTEGPIIRPAAAALTALPPADAEALLNHEWFAPSPDGWSLTPAGRQAVGN